MFGCCCNCSTGSIIDRWLNTTKVRPNDDGGTSGAPHYTCDPFARFNEGTKEDVNHQDDSGWCEARVGCVGCGSWLFGADMNGYSEQDTDLVDKIMACGSEDATHTQIDHNCYEKSGTVDMRVSGRRGGRWVLGKKYWHGLFGFTSPEICGNDPTEPASQQKYRTITYNVSFLVDTNTGSDADFTLSGSNTVGQKTGLVESTVNIVGNDTAYNISPGASRVITGKGAGTSTEIIGGAVTYFQRGMVSPLDGLVGGVGNCKQLPAVPDNTFSTTPPNSSFRRVNELIEWFNNVYSTGLNFSAMPAITDPLSYSGGGSVELVAGLPTTLDVSWTITNASLEWSVEWNIYPGGIGDDGLDTHQSVSFSGGVTLSDAYTASMCLADLYAAFRAWNLSENNLHYISAGRNWRRDEALALAPLVIYDEVQSAVSPLLGYNPAVDDYEQNKDAQDSEGRNVGDPGYVPTWRARNWFDPNGYLWQYPNGSRSSEPSGFTGSATLLGPMRTGDIIAAGIEGGERLFWFNADNWERVFDSDGGDPAWHWNLISKGALSDTRLPEATRRWMNLDEAQYDAEAYRGVDVPPPSGNYPQAFLRQQNGVLVGAKYVEATQDWPAVNFDYPCGDARWDVDQTTVCCIISGDATAGFRVKLTGNATGVPAPAQKIFVEGDGAYTVTTVDSHGGSPEEWTVHVGSRIEVAPGDRSCLPKGMESFDDPLYSDGFSHLGVLRWWTTSPTSCPETNDVSNRTGVKLEWSFNNRAARLDTADQPLWLGGTTAGDGTGITGCTGLSMSEFTYPAGACRAVVGFVPFYIEAGPPISNDPVEDFKTQTLHAMPSSFSFDDVFGSLWMGQVQMVMRDPFHQDPYKPSCAIAITDPVSEILNWREDNGSGAGDSGDTGGTEENPITIHNCYFPHRRWVAARCTIPSGKSLPSGVELHFATGSIIAPADGTDVHYDSVSGGIVLGGTDGSYRSIETPWGFTDRACSTGNRFESYYTEFTDCP